MFHFLSSSGGICSVFASEGFIPYFVLRRCWAMSSIVLYSLATASSYFCSSLALLSALFIRSAIK